MDYEYPAQKFPAYIKDLCLQSIVTNVLSKMNCFFFSSFKAKCSHFSIPFIYINQILLWRAKFMKSKKQFCFVSNVDTIENSEKDFAQHFLTTVKINEGMLLTAVRKCDAKSFSIFFLGKIDKIFHFQKFIDIF